MREVTPKTIDQQSIQALHRLRESATGDRTALSNQLRDYSRNLVLSSPRHKAHQGGLYGVLEDAENHLTHSLRAALALKHAQFVQLDDLVIELKQLINESSEAHQEIGLLQSAPGYGDILSSAFYSVIGDGTAFAKGRDASASLGVVPRQHSTGDKTVLLGSVSEAIVIY